MLDSPIIALDFPNQLAVEHFLQPFTGMSLSVKVGMELFYQTGPELIYWLKDQGHHIFLDLKLHDIPNTVKGAMAGLARLEVDMVNVHAAGGIKMMEAAKEGLLSGSSQGTCPKIIAVTQLTSTSETAMRMEQNIQTSLLESVVHYAKITQQAQLDGVVCSAQEVTAIKKELGEEFICLTPGIRPSGSDIGDQKRIVTPEQARKLGSDYIVVGRPITQAESVKSMYLKIKEEWMSVNDKCER